MFAPAPVRRIVQRTPEWQRVNGLPRRVQGAELPHTWAADMSRRLRRPGGRQTLRDVQACALYEIMAHRGMLGLIQTGDGKTLVSFLAPYVLGALRPLLVLPAGLVQKTENERRIAAADWLVPNHIRIVSYEVMGRVNAASWLDVWRPDVIIADECHYLRNKSAAVTKRFSRYFRENISTVFVGMTGTMTTRSIRDMAHLATWALKDHAPFPRPFDELVDWADCLDESYKGERPDPGPLVLWSSDASLDGVRKGFNARLTQTPGVIVSQSDNIDTPLVVTGHVLTTPPVVANAFTLLRAEMSRPDGELFISGAEVWRCARELALGFYYVWDPPPPALWRAARRAWGRLLRRLLGHNRMRLDSERQVKDAILAGRYGLSETTILRTWLDIEPTFDTHTVPVWLSDHALVWAADWARKPGRSGIVWTEHTAFGKELAKRACLRYYGRKGIHKETGAILDNHTPTLGSLVCSSAANLTGRNLQAMYENLEVSPEPNGKRWEQKMARTHRPGQTLTVRFDVLLACGEHIDAWADACADACYVQSLTGAKQKILSCKHNNMTPSVIGTVWQRKGDE